jgi:hypothetical protein
MQRGSRYGFELPAIADQGLDFHRMPASSRGSATTRRLVETSTAMTGDQVTTLLTAVTTARFRARGAALGGWMRGGARSHRATTRGSRPGARVAFIGYGTGRCPNQRGRRRVGHWPHRLAAIAAQRALRRPARFLIAFVILLARRSTERIVSAGIQKFGGCSFKSRSNSFLPKVWCPGSRSSGIVLPRGVRSQSSPVGNPTSAGPSRAQSSPRGRLQPFAQRRVMRSPVLPNSGPP